MTPLRQRMIDALVLHGKAARTQEAYVAAVAHLARHYRRSPDTLSGGEIEAYLLHLLRERVKRNPNLPSHRNRIFPTG